MSLISALKNLFPTDPYEEKLSREVEETEEILAIDCSIEKIEKIYRRFNVLVNRFNREYELELTIERKKRRYDQLGLYEKTVVSWQIVYFSFTTGEIQQKVACIFKTAS